MNFTLEPAAAFAPQLNYLIMKATLDVANEWFFYDGAHNGANALEINMSNTWLNENVIAISEEKEILAYFEGQWLRPMDIITGFRVIHFGGKHTFMAVKAFYGRRAGNFYRTHCENRLNLLSCRMRRCLRV